MHWPDSLIDELASRRCIIFIGSGVSAGCLSSDGETYPPTWKDFITELKNSLPSSFDKSTVDDLIFKEKYLDAAEIILGNIQKAEVSRIIRKMFVLTRYSHSKVHEAILDIDPKIVITTNYDDIYDNFCRRGMAQYGYNICRYYDTHLVTDLRSPVRVIIKAHGCVSDPSRIVLARSQYFKERQNNSAFYNVLDALFLTNTILFIGYSLSDPDIQLILENANIAAPSNHPHYALMPDNIPLDMEKAAETSYNIHFFKYAIGNYKDVESRLIELSNLVKKQRVSNPV